MAVSITTHVNVLLLKAWRPQCPLWMNAQARASNYFVSKLSHLKTYHNCKAVDTCNHNPPAHSARMPPDACKRLG
eukprot:6213592-Pleurochrysis_carterae.AAC.1